MKESNAEKIKRVLAVLQGNVLEWEKAMDNAVVIVVVALQLIIVS